jgi:4-carboxymuconolactone decarboxylase
MSRLPAASRDKIPEDQAALYDELVKRHGLESHGIGNALSYAPIAWRIIHDLRNQTRRECSLPEDVVKLAILVAARELDCQFLWNAHAGTAAKAGVPAGVKDALRDRTELPPLPDKHQAVIHYGRELYRNHVVSHGTFCLARDLFGEKGVVELGLLFGTHQLFAILLAASDAQPGPNRTEPILPIC